MRTAILLFAILCFVSQAPPGRGHFKQACERPNGFCQEYCLDSEIQVGRCLDSRVCCLPLAVPQVDTTTPSGGC
uniref:Defensin beta 108B n=1 Tax=Catagonus wagneri TaxID=51154 RepID=A0A8C3VVU6_9CETA